MKITLERSESRELLIMRNLNARMALSSSDKKNYFNMEKGYEGEVQFDALLAEELKRDCLAFQGLRLDPDSNEFQIDTVLHFKETIYLIDVKNYEGEYYYNSKGLFIKNGNEVKDPLIQLKRCLSLFRQFLAKNGFTFTVEACVLFINPEFTLYQAPLNEPIILPTEIPRFLKKLNCLPSNLSIKHEKLANLMVSKNLPTSRFATIPSYKYNELEKGQRCFVCGSLCTVSRENRIVCEKCDHREKIDLAIIRSVEEIKLLFPERKITTCLVQEWCNGIVNKKRIAKILKENLNLKGYGQWTYYE